MNSQDDPEARIRELEQPLADMARASELGGGGDDSRPPYPSVPPGPAAPPFPGYGGPYPGAAPTSSAGRRGVWILAAIAMIGLLVGAWAVATYTGRQMSRSDGGLLPPRHSASPTSAPRRVPNRAAPTTGKRHQPTPQAPPATEPAGAPVTISGIDGNRTIECRDGTITVSGISNTVVLTGHCARVDVSGVDNAVEVDAVDAIEASGLNNRVTYHSGSPKISKSGSGNVVEQG
ncbi:DUF3060 domain-containing protein [Mycobacterium sp.]|uniref:DUF3060 domain-containing protein n=1 Tax=Mycobacterium sp. TaxID=1785 RepID=UPI003A89F65E